MRLGKSRENSAGGHSPSVCVSVCELSFIVVYFRGKYLYSPAFGLSFIGDYFLPVDFAVYHGELALLLGENAFSIIAAVR